MSNPTELPDLDKLEADALECLKTYQYVLAEPDKQLALIKLARRAQPEGEAPQAEASSLPLDVEFKRLADTILQATTNGARLEALRGMAALFDNQAAQHAESGAPVALNGYIYHNRAEAIAAQPQGAQATDIAHRIADRVVRHELKTHSAIATVAEVELRAALAAKAEAPAPEVPDFYRKVLSMPEGPGVIGPAVQQAAAPGALKLQPDTKTLQFLTDVVTAAGLLEHGKQSKGLAERISRTAYELRTDLFEGKAAPSAPGTPEAPQTAAACDVLAERQRQVEVEGWESSADDRYSEGELVMAAVCYAMNGDDAASPVPYAWPWDKKWWKPGSDRRNLVKAGALILADIERLDRAAQLDGGQGESV